MLKTWLFLQTIIFELLSCYILLDINLSGVNWLHYIGMHAIACISFTILSWLLLPKRYKLTLFNSSAFLFGISFLMPLFGILGVLFSILIACCIPRKHNLITWVEDERSPLPLHSDELKYLLYGSGALREILVNNADPERRLLAVSAIKYIHKSQSVLLLQLALKDLSDDVRLLAYASLESIEVKINESISLLKSQLDYRRKASTASEIAQQYWELCYLGLAEGPLRLYYLEQAELYLREANEIKESASNNLLLGRIMIEQSKPEDAIQFLALAFTAGLSKNQVSPYLAEAAYSLKDYKLTRQYISQFPDSSCQEISQIRAYWL